MLVLGTYAAGPRRPTASLVAELDRSRCSQSRSSGRRRSTTGRLARPRPRPTAEADWTVDDRRPGRPAVRLPRRLPGRRRPRLGADRAQPAHIGRPRAGPPLTERLGGCLGREVTGLVPAAGAGGPRGRRDPDGPVAAGRHGADRARPADRGAGACRRDVTCSSATTRSPAGRCGGTRRPTPPRISVAHRHLRPARAAGGLPRGLRPADRRRRRRSRWWSSTTARPSRPRAR